MQLVGKTVDVGRRFVLLGLCRFRRRREVRPELAFTFLRSLPGVRRIVERSKRQILLELEVSLKSGAKEQKICELPTSGLSVEDILKTAARLKNGDYKQLFYASKLTGTIYASDTRHRDLCNTVYCDFAHTNPLHSDAFPSVGRMELEIVHMTSRLLSSDSRIEICGTVTSGGTESILTAIRASRDFICHTKGITNPEMYVFIKRHINVSVTCFAQDRVPFRTCGRVQSGRVFQNKDSASTDG